MSTRNVINMLIINVFNIFKMEVYGYQLNVGQILPLLPEGEGWDEGEFKLLILFSSPQPSSFMPFG